MNRSAKAVLALVFCLLLLPLSGCDKLRARDQLNKGVQAYKNARYETAIDHFQQAVNLDPKLTVARLYLATAYAQQYVPGADTPENNDMGKKAIQTYQEVIDLNPSDDQKLTSLKGIASIYFNMKDLDHAKEFHKKALQIDPSDPEEFYSIGVIDWTEAYKRDMELKNGSGIRPADPIKDKKACDDLKTKNQDLVDDGLRNLEQATKMREDYGDAMAYINLLYRQKADLECGDDAARQDDLKMADDWADKAMAANKRKQEKANAATGGGITTENPQQ